MTREEFDTLIRRCEKVSQESPRLYVARAVGLVVLAYGYLLLVLFGSLALCGLMVGLVIVAPATIKLALFGLIVFGGIFLAVLQGLWVRLQPPLGRPVTRDQAPQLFTLLDELRTALECEPFHHVLIVNDLNAAVVQIPRLGIFGWHRNYLLLGLPLMECLSPEEFRAVLAHEFAHSSRGHGRFGNWLYRVRRTWEQVIEQMVRRRTRWSGVLTKFLDWFWPRFNGHAFVLARANEYVADACAVRLAGAEVAARALLRVQLDAALLSEKFWPGVYDRAKASELPPAQMMFELQQALRQGPAEEDASRWLRHAFLLQTSNADTHPSLKDRLQAMGRPPSEVNAPARPLPIRVSAAEHFLGEQAPAVAQQLSDEWHAAVKPQWQARHAQARKLAEELTTLAMSDAPPGVPKLWEQALKLVNLHGDEAAVAVLEQVVALEAKHAGANFILGRMRLQKDDPQGVDFIETALRTDPLLTQSGCELLYAHFNRTGQRDRLRPLEHRADQFREQSTLAQQERNHISVADTFVPHQLEPTPLAELRKLLATEPDIRSAAVASKWLKYFPANPCFVVALKIGVPWWKPRRQKTNQALVQRLAKAISLPGNFTVFVSGGKLRALGTKIYAVPGAIIYESVK